MDPDISHSIRRIANIPRSNPQRHVTRANVLGAAEESLAAPFRSSPSLNLDNPEIYLEFLKVASGASFSPHVRCHPHAEAMGIKTRPDAWAWIANRVTGHMPDPQWQQADRAAKTGATSQRTSRRIGAPRYPPNWTAPEFFELCCPPASHGIQLLVIGAPNQPSVQSSPHSLPLAARACLPPFGGDCSYFSGRWNCSPGSL